MIKKILKIPIGVTALLISFIAVVLPWNLRFVYTTKVCSRLQRLAKKSKLIDRLMKRTAEDHGMEMGGKNG